MKLRRAAWSVFFCLALSSCSVNILETFGDPLTNEALLYDAQTLINEGDYNGALAKFAAMSATFLAKREVRVLRASAYAGVCGLDFLRLMDALANMGSNRIFPFLLDAFVNGTALKVSACVSAESELQAIGTYAAARTPDENLLMAMVAFAKMGNILSDDADGDSDGLVDGTYNPCGMTLAYAQQMATGLQILVDALTNVGGSTLGSDVSADYTAMCASMAGFPAPFNTYCAAPARVTTLLLTASDDEIVRSLIYEGSAVGLDAALPVACSGGDVTTCFCP